MRVALFFGFYEHSGWMVESRLCLPTSLSDRESKKMMAFWCTARQCVAGDRETKPSWEIVKREHSSDMIY